ncbi:hypothetical protein BJ878DRAFT_430550 [Calycina marina]|uniref:Uncharacterized protein n=1 Tax=Calycina marina TaxID=1763456 RepID=A0A9P8CB92_9HELO|nr:hypothetical protein BJ878DRAFT_430550 [Calycina marina]
MKDVNNDPRVGSARDNSTSPSAARISASTNSASFATLFSTLAPVSVYAAVCLLIFLVLRRKWPRVYAPRTFLSSLDTHERSDPLPGGCFNWIPAFYRSPDVDVLNKSSLDGYLFLRYLKLLCVICAVGCIITWPVLLPLHRYGGEGSKQLDILTFGNVKDPMVYYAHAFQAWLFFGKLVARFILYMVSRECVFFINLRQAHLLSPYYADRLSSRTVLFTCVPQNILDEKKLRKIFGESAKHIWVPREVEELDELVKDRESTARRLERAEITLIKKVNAAYFHALKNGHPDIITERWSQGSAQKEMDMAHIISPRSHSLDEKDFSSPPMSPPSPVLPSSPKDFPRHNGNTGLQTSYKYKGPDPELNGSTAAQWIPYSQRPVHRPLANYGRRVDTIKWSRNQLKAMEKKISRLRRQYKKKLGNKIPAVFIEFDSQLSAQSAYQTLSHHCANHMVADIVGVSPDGIIWNSLCLRWWERIVRRFAVQALIAVLVIFWSIPCALVGIISNIKFLTDSLPFLFWINDLPSVILGLISGLLPALGLSLLMSAVPFIMRALARVAGIPTTAKVELFTQNAYFVFQVVQVFLVTTLTSAASSALLGIIDDPTSAKSLLSQNLPKASNFYVSYFILQGLAMSATRMIHGGSIWWNQLLPNASGNPRLIARRYHRLRVVHWGAIYPVFTNMGVIAISYALIAPLVLGFAFCGLLVIYVTYRYNLLYVYSSSLDARGLHYPRALKQTLTGLYIAQICMIGLFALKAAIGPLVLMFGLVIFSVLVHISLNDSLKPLLCNLPRTLAVEEELRRHGESLDTITEEDFKDPEDNTQYDMDFDPGMGGIDIHEQQQSRGMPREECAKVFRLTAQGIKSYINSYDFITPMIAPLFSPSPASRNFILHWLHPEVFTDYAVLRARVPEYPPILYGDGVIKDAFLPPGMVKAAPKVWLPKDKAGVSVQEVRHSGRVIASKDTGAWMNEKGLISVDLEMDPREGWERMRF